MTCHRKNQTRASLNSNMRRRVTLTVLALAAQSGHGDGKTSVECVACGLPAIVGMTNSNPRAFNLGHVLADSKGGAYCPCNLLPLCRLCNEDMGDAHMESVLTPRYDPRPLWDGNLMWDGGERESVAREWLPPTHMPLEAAG